jgi:hypothetical protein
MNHTGSVLITYHNSKYLNDFGKVLREDMREEQ